MNDFDVIVIGAGPAGEEISSRTAEAGLRTAVVEADLVGGECPYWACIPSKALLRPMSVQRAAARLPGVSPVLISTAEVLARRDELIEHLDDSGAAKALTDAGITLFRGFGKLAGEKRVVVMTETEEVTLTANKAVVIATGSTAKIPPIEGVEDVPPWDSRDVTTSKTIPPRLVIIGGGVVAAEMAQAYASLGSKVTMLVRSNGLLDQQEPFVGKILTQVFTDMGIEVRTNVEAERVSHEGSTTLYLSDGTTVEADEYLVAVGRQAAVGGLGLDVVGLDADGPIEVDDQLLVKGVDGAWLYALGDVNGRSLLTHMGKYQARVAAAHIDGNQEAQAWADNTATPDVVFTDPQVASVGMTKAKADEAGVDVQYVEFDMTKTGAAYVSGDEVGRCCLIVDRERQVVLGATFVGSDVGELLHSATVAIAGEVPVKTLWHAVPSFPTQSEVWLSLLDQL